MTVWPKWLYGGALSPSSPSSSPSSFSPSFSVSWVWGKSRLFSKCMLLLYDPAVGWADYMAAINEGSYEALHWLWQNKEARNVSVDSNPQHVPGSGETPWRWNNIVLIMSHKWHCWPVIRLNVKYGDWSWRFCLLEDENMNIRREWDWF